MPRPPRGSADFPGMLSVLHEEVSAERSLAEFRHQEILAKLQEHFLALQANLQANLKKAPDQQEDIDKPVELTVDGEHEGIERQPSQMWAHRASKIASEYEHVLHDKDHADGDEPQLGMKKTEVKNASDAKGVAYISFQIKKLVERRSFEIATATLIFLNALVMCAEIQYDGLRIGQKLNYDGRSKSTDDIWPGAEAAFIFIDWLFGVLFSLEAVIKLVGFRCAYFCSAWNVLDFVCVAAFAIDKVATVFDISLFDAATVRLMRLFRLVRLVRLIRTLEKLETLYIMTTAIKGMRMVVLWAMVLLAIILMTCALFLSVYLQSTYFDKLDPDDTTQRELYKYFGSFSRCMFSMFELTLANWPPVARLLSEEVSEWFSVICVFHKLTIGFAVVGVINGVVFQETFQVAQTDDVVMVRQKRRSKQAMQQKMRALFQALDINRDGTLAFSEFMVVAAQAEVRLWLESLDIETDDLLTLFLLIDADGDGTLTLEELLAHIPRLRGTARGIDMLAVRKHIPAFQLLQEDDENNKYYTYSAVEAPSISKIGAIGEAKFHWGGSKDDNSKSNTKGLDEILRGA